jgi:hypothetical protein
MVGILARGRERLYAPADLLRGREHASVGLRLPAVAGAVLIVAAAGAALWFFLLRDGGGFLGTGDETPAFRFELRKVSGVALDGKPSKQALKQTARGLQATLDAMYSAGFVDPDQWEDGEFPAVLEAFSVRAAEGARKDLPDLTLGPAVMDLQSVKPGRSRLDVNFLLTPNRQPFAAVATTTFHAEGVLTGGGRLSVLHRGRFVMQRIEGRWLIVSYDVDGKLRPAKPERSP